jgi:hypothetical protein
MGTVWTVVTVESLFGEDYPIDRLPDVERWLMANVGELNEDWGYAHEHGDIFTFAIADPKKAAFFKLVWG